jgi:hypothetical protein
MIPSSLSAFPCQAILPLWKCLERVCSVQQNAAGSLRVSLSFPLLLPPRLGVRGLMRSLGRDGHVLDSRLRGNDRVGGGFYSRLYGFDRGACRGAKPLCVLCIPQDWGPGFESEFVSQPEESGLVLRKR